MKKILAILLCIICIAAVYVALYKTDRNAVVTPEQSGESTAYSQPAAEEGSPYKIYYDTLSDIEKQAYNEILSEIYDMPATIRVPRITAEQLDSVFSALLYDNPDLFFVGRKCTLITKPFSVRCSTEYIMEKDEYERCKAELEKVCADVMSSLSEPENEWQTELEIHDYIIENCEYKLVENDHNYSSAYGALVNGKAACEGYSKAAKLLLDMAGIENAVISGISKDEKGVSGAHMWNAVKINGDYYYLDCTWDDPVNEDGRDVKIYSYFNISDEMISATHSDFSHDFGCNSTKENYHIKTGRFFESYSRENEQAVAGIIADELEAGGDMIELRFGTKKAFDNAVDELIKKGRIYNVLSLADSETNVEFSRDSVSYYSDSELLTLTVVPSF